MTTGFENLTEQITAIVPQALVAVGVRQSQPPYQTWLHPPSGTRIGVAAELTTAQQTQIAALIANYSTAPTTDQKIVAIGGGPTIMQAIARIVWASQQMPPQTPPAWAMQALNDFNAAIRGAGG